MKKRVKKKHEHRYWLRNVKERKVTWQELLELFAHNLTPEEIDECIRQGTEDARKELKELGINDYTTPLEPVRPIKPVKAEVVTSEEQKRINANKLTCDDCKWKAENECPWDLMYDKPGVDYADDCMDFKSIKEKENECVSQGHEDA